MQWTPGNRGDIQDMRGRSGGRAIPLGLGGFLVVLVLSWLSGTNLFTLLGTDSSSPQTAGTSGEIQSTPAEEQMVDFVGAVAKDTQDVWADKLGSRYQRSSVALFRDAVQSGCGSAESATGPFYCPQDQKVYLDLGFFNELDRRFGAVTLFPLFPKAAEPAVRVIVQARKGSRAGMRLLPGLVLHEADGRYTAKAEAVLRHGQALELGD